MVPTNNGSPSTRTIAAWTRLNLTSTVYTGIGLSFGGLLGIVAHRFGGNPWQWILFGSLIPPGPLIWLIASDWMERNLRRLRRWRDEDLIDGPTYDRVRREAMDWYSKRWFRKELGKPSK